MPDTQLLGWTVPLLILIPLGAGFLVGMFFQARRHWTDRRVQQYQWEQKFRLAETDRQEAIEGYNRMGIEMKKIRATFDGHVERIESLDGELESERARAEELARTLEGRVGELETARAEGRKLQARLATAETASARKTQVYGELSSEHQLLEEEVEVLHEKARGLRRRLPEIEHLEGVVREREEEIAHGELRIAEAVEAHAKAIALLEARIGELEPYPARLAESERARAELLAANESELRAREVQRVQADAKLRALEDRLKEIDVLNARLAERERAMRASEDRHTQIVAEKAGIVGSLQERIKSLEPYPESLRKKETELAATSERVHVFERELRTSAARGAELEARIRELEPLIEELAFARAACAEEQETSARLEGRTSELADELATRERLVAELKEDLGLHRDELEKLGATLDEARARIAELEPWMALAVEREHALAELEERSAEITRGKDAVQLELESKRAELTPLAQGLAERERSIAEWQKRCDALERRAEQDQEKQEKRLAQAQEKLGELREARKELADLQKEVQRGEKALRLRDEQLSQIQTKLAEREQSLRAQEKKLDALAGEREVEHKKAASLQAEITRIAGKLEASETKMKELRESPRERKPEPAPAPARKGVRTVVLQPHPRGAQRVPAKATNASSRNGAHGKGGKTAHAPSKHKPARRHASAR